MDIYFHQKPAPVQPGKPARAKRGLGALTSLFRKNTPDENVVDSEVGSSSESLTPGEAVNVDKITLVSISVVYINKLYDILIDESRC